MGLYDWPPESSRQPGNSEKARRNISLEFRCDLELHERRRIREDAFQTQVVGEQPDQATAWGDYWIRIERATDAEHAKDFIFLERESEKGFPGYIEIVAMDVILEIDTRINLNTRAGVIVHDIFKRQQCVHRLEMIGQTI